MEHFVELYVFSRANPHNEAHGPGKEEGRGAEG